MQKPAKNQTLKVEISSMTLEGMGVARLSSGFVIFVQDAAVGDIAEVLIMKVQKNLAFAKIVRLITPSPDRAEPACPHYKLCGGCSFWHISYDAELRLKRDAVYNNIKKLGGVDFCDLEITGAPSMYEYRNKAQFPVKYSRDGRLLIGFYRKRSHDVVDLSSCMIQSARVMAVTESIREYIERSGESVYDEVSHKGVLRNIFVREGRQSGDILVAVVANAKKLRDEQFLCNILKKNIDGLCGVVLNINREKTNAIMGNTSRVLFGKDEMRDKIGELEFVIPHRSFYQVNPEQTRVLYEKAASLLCAKENETVLDLYCGAGTITSFIAKSAGRVIGVEVIDDAVRVAKENAKRNGLDNCEFYCGDAAEVTVKLQSDGLRVDALVVDPPRKGLDMAAVDIIARLSPSRIVYVSCDSATLGRDISRLAEHGYTLKYAEAVDMFPRTGHVESVVLLERTESTAI